MIPERITVQYEGSEELEYFCYTFLLVYLLAAVVMDFKTRKIYNWWILLGSVMGFLFSFLAGGLKGVCVSLIGMGIPIILIGLFTFGALGAGDIKLFMVVGIFLYYDDLVKMMVVAFILGGCAAFYKLLKTKGFRRRFGYFFHYVKRSLITGRVTPYKRKPWREEEIIHFSLYIFLATGLVLGGIV